MSRFRIVYLCTECGREARITTMFGVEVVICEFDEWWEKVEEE